MTSPFKVPPAPIKPSTSQHQNLGNNFYLSPRSVSSVIPCYGGTNSVPGSAVVPLQAVQGNSAHSLGHFAALSSAAETMLLQQQQQQKLLAAQQQQQLFALQQQQQQQQHLLSVNSNSLYSTNSINSSSENNTVSDTGVGTGAVLHFVNVKPLTSCRVEQQQQLETAARLGTSSVSAPSNDPVINQSAPSTVGRAPSSDPVISQSVSCHHQQLQSQSPPSSLSHDVIIADCQVNENVSI